MKNEMVDNMLALISVTVSAFPKKERVARIETVVRHDFCKG